MAASAQGIDVSSFQARLSTQEVAGFQFAFTKCTDGTRIDGDFKANWALIRSAGIHRGAYHELQSGNAIGQAEAFLATVKTDGLRPGDMLSVVASDYPGVTPDEVKAWCDHVHQGTSGNNPVLVYTDLSVGKTLGNCTGYPLWVAWPNPTAPGPAQIAPWKSWHLWQWGTRRVAGLGVVDADAYNGDAAEMTAWIDSFKPAPPNPQPPATGGRVVADGILTMNQAATAAKVHPNEVLWHTAQHRPHGFGPQQAASFDAGSWDQPLVTGTVLWTA
jgi:GH25 family lysozyme M1 (1,4-beta-N-acetylmuramidase)